MNKNDFVQKETILVIEDDSAIRESLQEILELKGYTVNTANNGQEGLSIIIRKTPTLVICDVNMPVMDGFELLRILNNSMKKEIIPPFLFLTARVANSDIRKGMNLGADDYITKPFNPKDLLANIQSKINKRKQIQLLAITKEQNRISDELHDSIQQLLASSLMGFKALELDMTILSKEKQDIYMRSKSFLEEALTETRNISHNISDTKNIDLKKKIEDLLYHLNEAGKIKTNFTYKVDQDFENTEKVELLRIIQEAISNIIKYAQAEKLNISIEANEYSGKLQINDNGKGFQLEKFKNGKGLENIKKRAEKLNANYKMESTPDKGTSILLSW